MNVACTSRTGGVSVKVGLLIISIVSYVPKPYSND